MKNKDIRKILDAFYKGETSIEEEQYLSDYFDKNEVDDDLSSDKEYFEQMKELENIQISPQLTEKIDILFENLEQNEKSDRRKRLVWQLASSVAAIALILILINYQWNRKQMIQSYVLTEDTTRNVQLLAHKADTVINKYAVKPLVAQNKITTNKNKPSEKKERSITNTKRKKETVHDDDYEKMMEAIKLVSKNLDKGLNQLNAVSDNLEMTGKILDKNINAKKEGI